MLSLRLQTLAGYYHHSEVVYDIGCDHGLLGLSLLDQPTLKELYLVDPSKDVIDTLQNNLIDSYITKQEIIKVLHQRGQDLVLNPREKTIFIAGMGGKEILEILQSLGNQLGISDRVVISPHRNILELRNYLKDSVLFLEEEKCLVEDGQFYQILVLSKNSMHPKVHSYGNNMWQGQTGREYRDHQIKHFGLHQNSEAQAYVAYLKQLNG